MFRQLHTRVPRGNSRESQAWHGDYSKVRPSNPNNMNQSPHPGLAGLPARILKIQHLSRSTKFYLVHSCTPRRLQHIRGKEKDIRIFRRHSEFVPFLRATSLKCDPENTEKIQKLGENKCGQLTGRWAKRNADLLEIAPVRSQTREETESAGRAGQGKATGKWKVRAKEEEG